MTPSPARPHLWFVNHYAVHPDLHGRAGRHYRLAQHLERLGWRVTVVAATTDHPSGRQAAPAGVVRDRDGGGPAFRFLRAPDYASGGMARIANMLVFTARLLALRGTDAPDLVIGSTVHPFAAWAASVVARRHGVPFVFETRDLWPETLIDMGALTRGHPLARLLRRVERATIERSRLVVSPLPGVGSYLEAHGHTVPFLWISNGVELGGPVQAPHEDRPGPVFTYFGSLGRANAVGTILTAFEAYLEAGGSPDARLQVVGSGADAESLRRRAASSPWSAQIDVAGAVEQSELARLSDESDALVANMLDLPLYKYGIALNKLFEYLSASRPVIFASNALNDPVADADAGFPVDADDAAALAVAMRQLEDTPHAERVAMGERGRRHVVDHYDYAVLATRLSTALELLLDPAAAHSAAPTTPPTTPPLPSRRTDDA